MLIPVVYVGVNEWCPIIIIVNYSSPHMKNGLELYFLTIGTESAVVMKVDQTFEIFKVQLE